MGKKLVSVDRHCLEQLVQEVIPLLLEKMPERHFSNPEDAAEYIYRFAVHILVKIQGEDE